MRNIRVMILQRLLPHYRTGVFKRFTEHFNHLTVVFGNPAKNEPLKNDTSVLPDNFIEVNNFYPTGSTRIFTSDLKNLLTTKKPQVIISVFNIGNLNLYRLFFLRKIFGFKLILWSFGYDPVRGFDPKNNFADKIRLIMCQKADAVIFYWQKGKEEIERFSGRRENFFGAPNTLDTVTLTSLKGSFDIKGRELLKNELGIKERNHFVYVGRLLTDKQIDLLIKAFGILSQDSPDTRLTIIGDGPERESLQRLAGSISEKIVFKGEIFDDEQTGKWLYVSNALVMPGRLGLSVVHSFCFDTPVISQEKDSYFHGEGIGYLKNGFNGFLTKDGDEKDLAGKMRMLCDDHALLEQMRKNTTDTLLKECSVDKMIDGFQQAVDYVSRKHD